MGKQRKHRQAEKAAAANKPESKMCVAGWTDYDDMYYPECAVTDEVFDAIVCEVREHGYLFGGDAHQDWSNCCPVMSNGCVARFSWRGWGAVIAAAYDQKGKCSYMAGYMTELIRPEAVCTPPGGVDNRKLDPQERTEHILDAPPSQNADCMFSYHRLWLLSATEEACKVKKGDFVYPRIHIDAETTYVDQGYKVIETYRGNTFEEACAAAEEDYPDTWYWYYGYNRDEKDDYDDAAFYADLRADYPDEKELGAVCYLLEQER